MVRKAKSHLLVQVKENQPGLLRKIEAVAEMDAPLAHYETIDPVRRLRAETRIVEVFDAGPTLEKTTWNGLITRIVRVQRATLERCAKDGLWERCAPTSPAGRAYCNVRAPGIGLLIQPPAGVYLRWRSGG